jgi:hypothetical protein
MLFNPAQNHHNQPDEANHAGNVENLSQSAKLLPFLDHWRLLISEKPGTHAHTPNTSSRKS